MSFSHRTPPRPFHQRTSKFHLQPTGPEVDCQPSEDLPTGSESIECLDSNLPLNKDGSTLPEGQVFSVFLKKNVGKAVTPPADLLANIQNRIALERARLLAATKEK